MGVFEIAAGLLGLVETGKKMYDSFVQRAKQNGELTPEQEAALDERAETLFSKYENAAPPPPPQG